MSNEDNVICQKCGLRLIKDFAGWSHIPKPETRPQDMRHKPKPIQKER